MKKQILIAIHLLAALKRVIVLALKREGALKTEFFHDFLPLIELQFLINVSVRAAHDRPNKECEITLSQLLYRSARRQDVMESKRLSKLLTVE